ncbi:MAG: ATP-binding protein [candidate division Zixibacteria bacterium]|nr:ATP-binding protein [candidate division Zixibacteria bacterium]
MKEIVVISGKGGTGKTSIVASFASLAKKAVLADCDVDAADLHLLLTPKIKDQRDFVSAWEAGIDSEKCSGCGECHDVCRFDAVIREENPDVSGGEIFRIDPIKCEGCGVCDFICPEEAITMRQVKGGDLFVSEMRYGPMVHAKLGIAAENSGKLVALVRQTAREIADKSSADYILVDGPPGIGCPVISSVTGADIVMIVTEPTLSGMGDLKRVAQLARHFKIPATVCINKHDINPAITDEIISYCRENDVKLLGRIRYDNAFSKAQLKGATMMEFVSNDSAKEIESVWQGLLKETG